MGQKLSAIGPAAELPHTLLKYYARHFPISKGKQRLVSLLWRRLTKAPYSRECALEQASVRMRCDLGKYLQRQLYFFGSYETATLAYWMDRAAISGVIFDVGANIGLYSLTAAAANPRADIHAFEPTSDLIAEFLYNVHLNSFRGITVNTLAVAGTSGNGYLHRCSGINADNEGMNYIADRNEAATLTDVVTLDDYCGKNNIKYVDLLKLDIEGGEYDALVGSKSLLTTNSIGCIFLELVEWAANRAGHSTREIKELLLDHGYHIYVLEGGVARPVRDTSVQTGNNVIAFPSDRPPD